MALAREDDGSHWVMPEIEEVSAGLHASALVCCNSPGLVRRRLRPKEDGGRGAEQLGMQTLTSLASVIQNTSGYKV